MHIVDDELPAEFKEHSVDWARQILAREASRPRKKMVAGQASRYLRAIRSNVSCVLQIRTAQTCSSWGVHGRPGRAGGDVESRVSKPPPEPHSRFLLAPAF